MEFAQMKHNFEIKAYTTLQVAKEKSIEASQLKTKESNDQADKAINDAINSMADVIDLSKDIDKEGLTTKEIMKKTKRKI
jgi:hypothetical protein